MRRHRVAIALSIILVGTTLHVSLADATRPRVIYGEDNRLDYHQVAQAEWRHIAERTVALIRTANLDPQGEWTNLRSNLFGESYGLCQNEPFYSQPTVAFCSGSLVGPDLVLSAGHCIRNQSSCENTRFVFGFRIEDASLMPSRVPSNWVYGCRRLIHSIAEPRGVDFSLVQLDRPVSGFSPLAISHTPTEPGRSLVVIGHPSGLPVKVAGGAEVRSLQTGYFVANLDTYGGNSGSAVFDANTGEITGILVRGEVDFEYVDNCRRSKRCESNACRGEDVTDIGNVIPYLNQ